MKTQVTRVALSKEAAAEGLGLELVKLSSVWLADGKFDLSEMEQLQAWLSKVPDDSIPAIRFLKEEVERYVADGEVLPWELSRLQAALIRIIPASHREVAKAAKREVTEVKRVRREVEQEKYRLDKAKEWAEIRRSNASTWADEPSTEAQLAYIRDLGGSVDDSCSKLEASEMTDRLLGNSDSAADADQNGGNAALVVAIIVGLAVVVLIAVGIRGGP